MYVLKRNPSRSSVPLADMANAIASVIIDRQAVKDVVDRVYEKLGKNLPAKPSIVLGSWRKKINDLLAAGDKATIALCKECEILDECDGVEPPRARRTKKTQT